MLLTIDVGRPSRARKGGPLCTRVRAKRAATEDDVFTVQRAGAEQRAEQGAGRADPFGDPAFAEAYHVEAGSVARVARRFTDELRREILALDPEEIAGGEAAVTLTLAGTELRRKPLERASEIVAALAAPAPEGPYR